MQQELILYKGIQTLAKSVWFLVMPQNSQKFKSLISFAFECHMRNDVWKQQKSLKVHLKSRRYGVQRLYLETHMSTRQEVTASIIVMMGIWKENGSTTVFQTEIWVLLLWPAPRCLTKKQHISQKKEQISSKIPPFYGNGCIELNRV